MPNAGLVFVILRHLGCQGDSQRRDLIVQGENSLCSIDQREGCSLCPGSYCSAVCPEALTQFLILVAFGTRDKLLEQFFDGFVEGFGKTIGWRVICCRGYALYPEFSAKSLERVTDELWSIIVHNSSGDAKAVDHMVLDELNNI